MAAVSPIIFLHIPKTAGTTVQHIMHNEYRGLKFFTSGNYKQIENFKKLSDEEKKKIKVIKGHFPFGVHKNYPGPITYFTFFRDPVKRSISDFNFLYQNKTLAFHEEIMRKQYSLKDMLNGGYIKNFDNCHVRFLAGANDLEYGKVNEETYALALKNFDTYFETFGISERVDESLIYIKRKLNWSMPFYVNANVSEKSSYRKKFDEETYRLLEHYNKFDIMLYNHACKKFDSIVLAGGVNFKKEVDHFIKLNKLQRPVRKAVRKVWKFFQRFNRN